MKYFRMIIMAILFMSGFVICRDCQKYKITVDELYQEVPIINKCILQNKEVFDYIPRGYFFEILGNENQKTNYLLGTIVDFSLIQNKAITIEGCCQYIEENFI